MLDLFGQEAVPASPLPVPGKKPRNQMSATYGRILQGSSESAILQKSLESKLQARLPMAGSMMPLMTWKQKTTPAGRRYCQLAVSVRRINETGCGLLPTTPAQQQQGGIRLGGGSAACAKWRKLLPTVTKRDEKMDKWSPAYEKRKSPSIDALSWKHGRIGIVDLAALAGWMMGYPREWLNQLWQGSVMQSSRKSPPSSSTPIRSAEHDTTSNPNG